MLQSQRDQTHPAPPHDITQRARDKSLMSHKTLVFPVLLLPASKLLPYIRLLSSESCTRQRNVKSWAG